PDAKAVVTVVAGVAQHQDVELTKGEKITGKVVDSTGKPVARATVNSEAIETALLRGRNRDLKRILDLAEGLSFLDEVRAESGGDGSFTLTGVTPGVHSLRASRPGFLSTDPVQAAGGAHDVLVRLRAGTSIVGRVVDLEKKPLAGAKVS